MDEEMMTFVENAIHGDSNSLEKLIMQVQDMIFNLSLRILGTVADAEDASQEILIRVISKLSSFRGESSFKTWVYRICVNYLINYKKSMFSMHSLDFTYYGNDIRYAKTDEIENLVDELSRESCVEELKLSCTNVMLQCLDTENRCIFVLGTMFKMNSQTAAEILDITPESYRQRLSRSRKKVACFLGEYCGLTNTGMCHCEKRVNYAIANHRIHPKKLDFQSLEPLPAQIVNDFKDKMEVLDELALTFESFPHYKSPAVIANRVKEILQLPPNQNI